MKLTNLLFLCLTLIAPSMFAGSNQQELKALDRIEGSRLLSHIRFLAHDLLEGRGTATRGYDLAALYVACQFEQIGLKPGNQGTFFQRVPLRKADIVSEGSNFAFVTKGSAVPLRYETDFLMAGDYLREETSVEAEAIFAGYGVTAPEMKYDSYEGIDVREKIVVILSGAPETFPASLRAHHSSSYIKEKNALAHGAVGIVNVRTPVDEKRSPWERSIRQNKLSGYRWLDSQGKPNEIHPQIKSTANLSREGAEKLFQSAPQTLSAVFDNVARKAVKSFPMNLQIKMTKKTKHDNVESSNVVAVLEGSDPVLKNEAVVFTAHLDHLGVSEPVDGDRINNGAYDNGTGIAALLEIARAFQSLTLKPKRSIVLVAVTAEEKGLQGSDFFVNNPTIPLHSIVANINMDMYLILYPVADAVILGSEHSTIGETAKQVVQSIGLKVSPDPAPEEVRFVRSDQYSFIKKGIPAVKILAGFASTDPSTKGAEVTRHWLQNIYHTPKDELPQSFHWPSGVKLVQAHFLIGYRVANSAARPRWYPNDFFGRTYSQGRSDITK